MQPYAGRFAEVIKFRETVLWNRWNPITGSRAKAYTSQFTCFKLFVLLFKPGPSLVLDVYSFLMFADH